MNIYQGTTLYEIVYDRSEPFIYDYQVSDFDKTLDGYVLYDKFIGVTTITEDMIGSTIFFSYEEAQKRLDYISERGG